VKIRKLAVIMDPIEFIKPNKDSSLAMMLEAQKRGWKIYYGQLSDIWLRDGQAFGRLTRLQVADDQSNWFELGDVAVTPLSDMDVILMRKDPPFDMEYIVATYVLQRAEDHGSLVVNRPQSLRDANEKAFLSWLPECAPPTLISRSLDEMNAFITEHHKAVIKPLHFMGGRSVFVTDANDGNRNAILETVSDHGNRYIMVQKYLPEITDTGDKRVILVDGEPIPKALTRIPTGGDHRGNMNAGARTEIVPLTERDRWLCEQIGPTLRKRGLVFTGIDIIGEYITEINVTSPTGIRELESESDIQITKKLFDSIESKFE
jgi:glutathione synthase